MRLSETKMSADFFTALRLRLRYVTMSPVKKLLRLIMQTFMTKQAINSRRPRAFLLVLCPCRIQEVHDDPPLVGAKKGQTYRHTVVQRGAAACTAAAAAAVAFAF
jgi:hypothetical protein